MAFVYYLRNKFGDLKTAYYICVKNTQIKNGSVLFIMQEITQTGYII